MSSKPPQPQEILDGFVDEPDINRTNSALWATVFSGIGTIKEILSSLKSASLERSSLSTIEQQPVLDGLFSGRFDSQIFDQKSTGELRDQFSQTDVATGLDCTLMKQKENAQISLQHNRCDENGSCPVGTPADISHGKRDNEVQALKSEIDQQQVVISLLHSTHRKLLDEREKGLEDLNNVRLLNAQLVTELNELKAVHSALEGQSRFVDVQTQTKNDGNQELASGRKKKKPVLRTESLDREKDFARVLSAQDAEIQRLRMAAARNSDLAMTIADLRRRLKERSAQVEVLKKDRDSFASLINCENAILHLHAEVNHSVHQEPLDENHGHVPELDAWYRQSKGIKAGSRTSLNSETYRFERDSDFVGIHRRSSWRASQTSVSSRTGSQSFRYNENTPSRLEELERRNKAQKPHLKSSYPAESRLTAWRQDAEETTIDNEAEKDTHDVVPSAGATSLKNNESTKKHKGIFKKIQNALQGHHSKEKGDRIKEQGEKPVMGPVEKPVAFVVQITPEKRSQRGKSKN